jgi:hypothetical protein
VSLAICKYLEIQTGKSARFIIDKLKSVTDARMLNTITGKETLIRGEISAEVQTLLSQINPPH